MTPPGSNWSRPDDRSSAGRPHHKESRDQQARVAVKYFYAPISGAEFELF